MLTVFEQLNERRRSAIDELRTEWNTAVAWLAELADDAEASASKLKELAGLLERAGKTSLELKEAVDLRRRRRMLEAELATRPTLEAQRQSLIDAINDSSRNEELGRQEFPDRFARLQTELAQARADLRTATLAEKPQKEDDVRLAKDSLDEAERELKRGREAAVERRERYRSRMGELQNRLRELAEAEIKRIQAAEEAAAPAY